MKREYLYRLLVYSADSIEVTKKNNLIEKATINFIWKNTELWSYFRENYFKSYHTFDLAIWDKIV